MVEAINLSGALRGISEMRKRVKAMRIIIAVEVPDGVTCIR